MPSFIRKLLENELFCVQLQPVQASLSHLIVLWRSHNRRSIANGIVKPGQASTALHQDIISMNFSQCTSSWFGNLHLSISTKQQQSTANLCLHNIL